MRVIVTRPAAQAADWVIELQRHRIDAVALPLIAIAPALDAAPLAAAWRDLASRRLAMFVSANAVQHFFGHRSGAAWPAGVLAGSPGPGTTRALLALGVPAVQIVEPAADAAQFDSEALWARLAAFDWHGASVLVVRGDGGRDWLADMLRAHGAQVEPVAAYRRAAPQLDAVQRTTLRVAIDEPDAHLWFFSSSEAIEHLDALVATGTSWQRSRALATHPRIAARARRSGFASVTEARPTMDAVVACIQSIRP